MSTVDVFPLSTSAYIADTQHLSLVQDGAYLRIMMTMWRAGGWIDDDDRKLANVCKLSLAKWLKIADPIRRLLLCREGRLSQKRLLFEIEKELKRVSKNRQNGSAGGRAKALKSNNPTVATARGSLGGRQRPETTPLTLPSLNLDSIAKEERKKGRGASLPADWRPSVDELEFGRRLGLTGQQIDSMAEDMRLWARANSNRSVARKADWSATFKNWMKRERGKASDRRQTSNGSQSLLARMLKEKNHGPTETVDDERTLPTGDARRH